MRYTDLLFLPPKFYFSSEPQENKSKPNKGPPCDTHPLWLTTRFKKVFNKLNTIA